MGAFGRATAFSISRSAPYGRCSRKRSRRNRPATVDWMKVVWTLPLKNIPEMTGVRSQFLADVIAHEPHDAFWKAMSVRDKYGEMDIPALHVTGWYDDLSRRHRPTSSACEQSVADRERAKRGSGC